MYQAIEAVYLNRIALTAVTATYVPWRKPSEIAFVYDSHSQVPKGLRDSASSLEVTRALRRAAGIRLNECYYTHAGLREALYRLVSDDPTYVWLTRARWSRITFRRVEVDAPEASQ